MIMDVNSILTKNLIRLRVQNQFSQRDIAEVLKISQPSYNRIECGKTQLNLTFLYKLAKFYKVMADDFFYSGSVRQYNQLVET